MKLVVVLVASLVSLAFGVPLKLSEAQSSLVEVLTKNNVCKDGKICGTTSTCCNGLNDESGCCVYRDAVCCSDGRHCCPAGYECDVIGNTCTKGKDVKLMADVTSSVSDVICPGGMAECPDGNTCCKLPSGQYGCCPLPNAVCCSDGEHCCPSGYTCDVSAGTCSRGEDILLWSEKSSATPVHLESVVCPGGQAECPDGNTCCKLPSGQYGCCPLPNAVCCSDGEHCCPSGYTCDVSAGTCSRGDDILLWSEKSSASPVHLESVVCPGGQAECPDGNTCCRLPSGQYGCCPLPNAVCCSDGEHCCPSGYTCDVSAGTCSRGDEVVLWSEKSSATPVHLESVVCPGGQAECPDGNTCCKLPSGQYGCCPLPNAVCCSDGQHCCPSGYTCDVSAGTCSRGDDILLWSEKSSATPVHLENVVCPGGTSECPDGNTCCKLPSGQYGCCPLTNAVCCSDGQHCCPSGYTCDVSAGTCSRGDEVVLWSEKSSATPVHLESVVCPGGQAECPDGNTCCKLSSGQYGCCPLPNTVCCSDGQHCCPSGYTCDSSAGTCSRGDDILLWSEKSSATPVYLESVVCPGGQAECPDGNTCCRLPSGQYGCCPLPNAVCCSDGEHCCPAGYTCDVSAGTCSRGDEVVIWSEKSSATPVHLENVVCPGGTSECPDGNTCCKLPSGQYGCCPLPNAVCCSDGEHCCPSGYTCDVGTCSRGDEVVLWSEKSSATPVHLESVVCPGGTSECPDGNTCCKLPSGQYGCCPLPNAVCCSDGEHCCPSGYTCDVGTCSRGDEVVLWSEKSSATPVHLENVVCPGGTSECPDGNTCCKLPSGQYGCCPLPNAVCCSDGEHCCPSGYTCDVSAGTCSRGDEVVIWSEKFSATPVHLESVVCPGGTSECPDGNTCCKLPSGQYGCCPLPNAVCCSDGEHCCPSGYTCDVGTCSRGDEVVLWSEKSSATPVHLESVVCPGGQAECPDGNTCCKLPSGQYGCCPLPNAVCCSDGQHCCPSGYTCDVSAGTCSRGDDILLWSEKSSATPVHLENVVCPGGTLECPDGNTCCKLPSGQYGCCPLPNAVCCSDGEHCCPSGYTCDVGTCSRGDEVVLWSEKSSATPVHLESVVCPGGTSECPDGNTCCKLPSGQIGCCPLPNAVCCSDGEHCCPSGYTCEVGTCSRGDEVVLWSEKSSATPVHLENVVCPGGTSECPDGNTCCKLLSGQYGCCPLPNAVCCSDGEHCCPSGYTCDSSAGTCSRGDDILLWSEKSSATPVYLESVVCPGGQAECPDGNTCCRLPSGQYGCCPLPNAVCCSDGEHCCPSGYTCDVSAGTCSRGDEVVLWSEKSSATPVHLESVVCPGGQAECPDGNTCCKLSSGQYGCCPFPNAVCCSDGQHCCPSGYTCDSSAGTCTRGNSVLEWSSKSNAHTQVQNVQNLATIESGMICPDSKTSCPPSNTCCPLTASGEWGCCPVQNAVCCDDHIHCCPSGYTCGTSSCKKGSRHLPLLTKSTGLLKLTFEGHGEQEVTVHDKKHLLFQPDEPETGSVVCPGGQAECPDGNTCCLLASGQYGCCPLPQAVCCADKEHCCPSGYTCDPTTAECTMRLHRLPWFSKVPSTPLEGRAVSQDKPGDKSMCPDDVSSCPSGSTCCQTPGGIYGCCPYQAAICCSDLIHCCPSGYACQTSTGTCTKEDHIMPWGAKIPIV